MSAASTTRPPVTAPLDDTNVPSGAPLIEVDPRGSAGQSTDSDQRERTIAEVALNALRLHAVHDDDLAWAAAAFHPM